MAYKRIVINKITEQVREGRAVTKERPFYSPTAEVRSLYGKELYDALSIKLESTAVFRVRICAKVKEIMSDIRRFTVESDGGRYQIYAFDTVIGGAYVDLKANGIK